MSALRNIFLRIAIPVAAAWLNSCAPAVRVNSDYDRQADFSQYRSYAISPDGSPASNDPIVNSTINQRRITQALDSELKERGYTPQEQNPDLRVTFHTDVQEKQEVRSYNNWGYWWWRNNNNLETRNYEQARLIIDFIDARTNQLVWQGWASGELGDVRKKDRDELIREVVSGIMDQFPYRAGSGTTESAERK